MIDNFYVYEHWRPDRDECFYVGKGRGRRAYQLYKRNAHHKAIQAKLGRMGLCVEVRIVQFNMTEQAAFDLEIERIKFWKEFGADLANIAIGGGGNSGYVASEETNKKISNSLKGRKKPPEVVAKIAKANKGRIFTPEWRENISKSQKGKPMSPLARQKLAEWRKTAKRSEEHKKKISEAAKKRFQDPAVKEQFRLHSVGRVPSEETRMKMSIAAKNRRQRERAEGKLTIGAAQ
jgi:NUMOD3 motif